MNLCVHTLASFAEDAGVDEQTMSETSSLPVHRLEPEASAVHDKSGTFDEMNKLAGYEDKIRWVGGELTTVVRRLRARFAA